MTYYNTGTENVWCVFHFILVLSLLSIISCFIYLLLTQKWRKLHNEVLNDLYCSPNIVPCDKFEKNEMGGACSTYGGRGETYTAFWWGNLRKRDHLGDPELDGSLKLRWIFRKWDVGGMDWIELAQDRDRRRPLVSTVMNLRVP